MTKKLTEAQKEERKNYVLVKYSDTVKKREKWRWWETHPEKFQALEDAFVADATDEMACKRAGISTDQLYYYQKKHPHYSQWKRELKNNPNVKAKLNVIDAINAGKIPESQWWLERKARGEFGNVNQNINVNVDAQTQLDPEEKENLRNLLYGNATENIQRPAGDNT